MSSNNLDRGAFQGPPDNRAIQNQPTSSADALSEDLGGDADEPPDERIRSQSSCATDANSQFQKFSCARQNRHSLLTHYLHTSESDSQADGEDLSRSDTHRTLSSASTYSRGSVVSMAELTSDGGHVSSQTQTPSPPLPPVKFNGIPSTFNNKQFDTTQAPRVSYVDSVQVVDPIKQEAGEKKVEAGLGRKRCITFACASKENAEARVEPAPEQRPAQTKRPSVLKFACPTREGPTEVRPRTRLASPPPPAPRQPSPPKQQHKQRVSDATIRNLSPKASRKIAAALRSRRESGASDMSRPEATQFHEFAGSEEEDDDWTRESSCFRRRLTVEDTLAFENDLRRLAREVEDEENDENAEEEEDVDEDDELARSTGSGWVSSDDGFQSDDEHGFAHSDDDEDAEYDWWAPGTVKDSPEFIRPTGSKPHRSNSESSTESTRPFLSAASSKTQRKKSQPVDVQHPELPDSTDFVCGTLDEDKPLERAYVTHLETRRAAKHRAVPQDIDPTFPTSDPEMDDEDEEDEEDEVDMSETVDGAMESDHPAMFLHGQMDLHEDPLDLHPRRLIPKKRSPLHSPKRLRSPPPAKRISLHRSPPPHQIKTRGRSPAPPFVHAKGLSLSVPRGHHSTIKFNDFASTTPSAIPSDDEQCQTPRFVNRGAMDIVMGLETKRLRRREKLYERHCKLKAQRERGRERHRPVGPHFVPQQSDAPVQMKWKGKGAEKMREIVTRGTHGKKMVQVGLINGGAAQKKNSHIGPLVDEEERIGLADVHMLSY